MNLVFSAAPVREQTLKSIRKAIIDGVFHPGQKLVEKNLCSMLGVSRSPIREALRQLESEGLIKMIPNKGPYVAKHDLDEIDQIYEVRKILEAHASRLFAERADPKDLADLKSAFEALESEILSGKNERLLDYKENYYQILMLGAKNKILSSMHFSLRSRITFFRKASLKMPNRPRKSLEEISKIFYAIQEGDASAAWDYSIEHVEKAKDAVIETMLKDSAKSR